MSQTYLFYKNDSHTKQNPDEAAQQALSYLELGVKAVKPRVSGTRKDEKIIETEDWDLMSEIQSAWDSGRLP